MARQTHPMHNEIVSFAIRVFSHLINSIPRIKWKRIDWIKAISIITLILKTVCDKCELANWLRPLLCLQLLYRMLSYFHTDFQTQHGLFYPDTDSWDRHIRVLLYFTPLSTRLRQPRKIRITENFWYVTFLFKCTVYDLPHYLVFTDIIFFPVVTVTVYQKGFFY